MQISTPHAQYTQSHTPRNIAASIFSDSPHTVTSLTDKERDEIDFEAKTIIRRIMDQIKVMQKFEEGNDLIESS